MAQQLVRLYSSCRGGDVTEALQYTHADKVSAAAAVSPSPPPRLSRPILHAITCGGQVIVQAAQAEDMGSDGDSEVSDGDDATNEQLQQQYVHGGGMMSFGGAAAAAPSPAGLLPLIPALLLCWPCV